MKQIIEKIKCQVHQKLDFSKYNDFFIRNETNCFAHAIGSQAINVGFAYRIGVISGEKAPDKEYSSSEEVEALFLKDLEMLELKASKIPFENKEAFLKKVSSMKLMDNEHIVVLFVIIYADGKIFDFHFIRYDQDVGWTEKRYGNYPSYLENIQISWPTGWEKKAVGAFKITK